MCFAKLLLTMAKYVDHKHLIIIGIEILLMKGTGLDTTLNQLYISVLIKCNIFLLVE